jgi:GNAT superfamily N-acetyltransferase
MGAEGATKRLAREGSYGVVAVDVDAIVGFAAYEPAREETDAGFAGPLIPGLAHVWAVFVAESHWGHSVATRLLAALTDHIRREARARDSSLQARWRRSADRRSLAR